MREGVVLIIDNDKKTAEDLSKFLFSNKHEALIVSDKIEAFKSMDAIKFDLIVLEINIPDGFEILRYAKEKKPRAEVIIFSNCNYNMRKEVERMGGIEFLPKKVELSVFLDVLNFIIGA